jgi:hypothetical protein
MKPHSKCGAFFIYVNQWSPQISKNSDIKVGTKPGTMESMAQRGKTDE